LRKLIALCAMAVLCLSTANSTPISKQLGLNPDGTRSTQYPCVLSDSSDCKSAPTSLAWTSACLDTALAPLTNVQVGTPVDAAVDSCLTGTNASSATISFVKASDGSSCNTDFTVTGSSPNRKIHDAATTAGSGTCKPKAVYMTTTVLSSNSYAWANITPAGGDSTAPTTVTGITCTPGTLAATCTFDAQMDPGDAVVRSGLASYKIYSDLSFIDTLAAASPGLNCHFTAQTIGAAVSGSPSATQGTGFTGTQWTVNARGYGLEAADSYYGVSCPVSGNSVYAIARIDTIPAAASYNKAPVDIRNSTSTTSAHYACPVMRQVLGGVTTYYIQRTMRSIDGGSNVTNSSPLPGAPPYYVRGSVVSNLGECDYSTDGGTWNAAFQNDPITLNDSKIAVFGGSATSSGADDAAIGVVYGQVAVETAGVLSKTVTLTAGSHTLKVSDTDVAGNEAAQNGGVTIVVNSGGGGGTAAKKWHTGYYLSTDRNNNAMQSQTLRFAQYDGSDVANNSHLTGVFNIFRWNQLEGAHGDYSSGVALIAAEIAHLKALAQPKRLIAMIMDEPNYSLCSGATCQTAFFPAYLNNAGCVEFESGTPGTGTGGITHFKIWVPTCRVYFDQLIAALGAAFDSETYFEAIGLNYETSVQDAFIANVGGNNAFEPLYDAALSASSTAAAAAFPHTNIFWSPNYNANGDYNAIAAWMTDWKSKGIGWGDGDSCNWDFGNSVLRNDGTAPWSIWADNITAGYGQPTHTGPWTSGVYTDHRGSAFLVWKVETSELGYNAVCVSPGFTGTLLVPNPSGYSALFPFWNDSLHVSHGIVDHNTFIGTSAQRWSVGTTNSLWDMVQNHPLTHTACPTSYDTKFGDGSVGSGCNTN
jgi:hypothetical protein